MSIIKVATPSQISHEFIECDNCGKSNPNNRCARCHSAYYCSKECQRKDWKYNHKQWCVDVKEQRKVFDGYGKDVPESNLVGSIAEGPCVICLEETITNPVVLDCTHVFCFKCLDDYQKSLQISAGKTWVDSINQWKCPYCRGEMPNLRMEAFERARLYGERASTLPIGSDERKKCLQLAVSGLDAVLESDEEHSSALMALAIKGKVLIDDDPETAMNIFEKALLVFDQEEDKTTEGYWDGFFSTKLYLGKAYQAMEKWRKSNKVYISLRDDRRIQITLTIPQRHELFTGISRNFYELGVFDESIKYGEFAIESCRFIEGGHKYVALSQKAMGEIDAAKKTLSRAVLYEAPWDEENLKNNLQMLNDLKDK